MNANLIIGYLYGLKKGGAEGGGGESEPGARLTIVFEDPPHNADNLSRVSDRRFTADEVIGGYVIIIRPSGGLLLPITSEICNEVYDAVIIDCAITGSSSVQITSLGPITSEGEEPGMYMGVFGDTEYDAVGIVFPAPQTALTSADGNTLQDINGQNLIPKEDE